MSKTVELRTELQRLLKTVTTNVHYDIAPSATSFPYLVYEISELTSNYGKTLMELEINVFDYGDDTNNVEIIADELQDKLHKNYFINDKIQFVVYRGLRGKVEENDKQIIRRRLTFEIQLHELKGE